MLGSEPNALPLGDWAIRLLINYITYILFLSSIFFMINLFTTIRLLIMNFHHDLIYKKRFKV